MNPQPISPEAVAEIVARSCPLDHYRGKRVLLVVPDGTRTAPVGLMFKAVHKQIAAATKSFDVLIALGTHPPMSEAAIGERLEITLEQRRGQYRDVQFLNHEWNNPAALKEIGVIPAKDISELTGGLFAIDVSVEINKR